MKVFRLVDTELPDDTLSYAGTMAGAKALAKDLPAVLRKRHTVEELEVQTDKAGVVAMLNNAPIVKVVRTFAVSARGGVQAIE